MRTTIKFLFYISYLIILCFASCKWAKEKTVESVHKAGEIVGKTTSEFGDGIYKGIKKTFENEVSLSNQLKENGIEIGEINILSDSVGSDNIASIYMIFNESFDKEILIKLYNEGGKEFGRCTKKIQATKGEARFIDFQFDKHVTIGLKGKIIIE